ncbi:MAG TPA: hypothetical protein PLA90_14030, partial [Candidatus Sumerlaeota bacterium]|nr:hypothetical protein [Candidatus Sumerlaeota bacterium]
GDASLAPGWYKSAPLALNPGFRVYRDSQNTYRFSLATAYPNINALLFSGTGQSVIYFEKHFSRLLLRLILLWNRNCGKPRKSRKTRKSENFASFVSFAVPLVAFDDLMG